jgi:hypothetical protein
MMQHAPQSRRLSVQPAIDRAEQNDAVRNALEALTFS